MTRTGTTLCHPKICYVDLTRNTTLDTLALNSPLGHFNGDQRTPLHQTGINHGDSKTQSLSRPTTHAAISAFSTHYNAISSPTLTSLNTTSLAAPKANPIFHGANKNIILKHISTIAILLLHSTFIFTNKTTSEGLTTLSEETTQPKHISYNLFSLNNKLSLATNKPTSPAKIILQKLWLQLLITSNKSA